LNFWPLEGRKIALNFKRKSIEFLTKIALNFRRNSIEFLTAYWVQRGAGGESIEFSSLNQLKHCKTQWKTHIQEHWISIEFHGFSIEFLRKSIEFLTFVNRNICVHNIMNIAYCLWPILAESLWHSPGHFALQLASPSAASDCLWDIQLPMIHYAQE